MPTLGVVVLSLRGMQHLSECLESVKWADAVELLHVGEGEPPGGVSANFPLVPRKLASTEELGDIPRQIATDWVLYLWGEERVEPELREELRELCQEKMAAAPFGYRIPIRSRLLGCWVEGSLLGPSPSLRLSRGIEEITSGWWGSAENRLQGYPTLQRGWLGDYSAAELKHGFDRLQDISQIWAERLQTKGENLTPLASVLRPLPVFIKVLLRNRLFLNGFAGLTLSTLAAYGAFLACAKIWEARNVTERKKGGE